MFSAFAVNGYLKLKNYNRNNLDIKTRQIVYNPEIGAINA